MVLRLEKSRPARSSAGKFRRRAPATGSVLIVHGNAGCALGRDYIAQPIHDAADVEVFVLEYPGYGARAGSPSKTSLLAAAEEAFQLLPSGSPKYVVSESIGAGVACELARNHPARIAGTGVVCAVPQSGVRGAETNAVSASVFSSCWTGLIRPKCLKRYHGPVKFVVAGADEILGPEPARSCLTAYAGPKNSGYSRRASQRCLRAVADVVAEGVCLLAGRNITRATPLRASTFGLGYCAASNYFFSFTVNSATRLPNSSPVSLSPAFGATSGGSWPAWAMTPL